jgi:acetylornithine deacetylase
VAAMLCAAKDLIDAGGLEVGRLLVLLGYGEETKNTTMERAVARAGPIDASVVGEPTNLAFAIAQRGLLMADLLAQGDQRHAGYAAADGEFTNATLVLARDLLRLGELFESRSHPVLGHTIATPTMLEAGVSRNVTPPVAKAVLDIRSTPDWTHEELAEELRNALTCEVIVTSRRLVPCETPAGSRLLDTASRLRPGATHFGSPTCSDWVFLRHCDAFKCGPGTSRRSHTADEYVDTPEVMAARGFYADLARAYLAGR